MLGDLVDDWAPVVFFKVLRVRLDDELMDGRTTWILLKLLNLKFLHIRLFGMEIDNIFVNLISHQVGFGLPHQVDFFLKAFLLGECNNSFWLDRHQRWFFVLNFFFGVASRLRLTTSKHLPSTKITKQFNFD